MSRFIFVRVYLPTGEGEPCPLLGHSSDSTHLSRICTPTSGTLTRDSQYCTFFEVWRPGQSQVASRDLSLFEIYMFIIFACVAFLNSCFMLANATSSLHTSMKIAKMNWSSINLLSLLCLKRRNSGIQTSFIIIF